MENKKINWKSQIFLIIGSLLILFPLYLTIVTAFKTPQELSQSLLILPEGLNWNNFTQAIKITHFSRSLYNTFFIAFGAVILTLLTNSMVAYAVARNMHKKFFKFLYYYFISALFIPFPIIMLPIVKQTSIMGLDNKLGLILLYTVYGLSMNVFLYVGYIKTIPKSLEEAAIIDGCNRWQVFWKIVFPLMSPINAAVGILTTLWAWNDFFMPLVILTDKEDMTLNLVQYAFQGQFETDYHLAFASYLLVLSPIIIIYVFAQKWIVSGVMRGSIKS